MSLVTFHFKFLVTCYHPELPIIISGSEDGTIRIWHSNTYRLENTLNYGMERVWALGYLKVYHYFLISGK
jgi:WD40 repeat protein